MCLLVFAVPCNMFVQFKLVTEYASDIKNKDFLTVINQLLLKFIHFILAFINLNKFTFYKNLTNSFVQFCQINYSSNFQAGFLN